MIILYDIRNPNHIQITYASSLDAAEQLAVLLMDEIKQNLPAKAWQRGEYVEDVMQYFERGRTNLGSRIYVTIVRDGKPKACQECSELVTHEIRDGSFCDKHYDAYLKDLPR